ncbi:MAG: hypothetical protein GDA39_07950 [Hyphomonadaceae bacterium]|nr:hypothetical protein [Hyphomonadaceae bacterium]MBC6412795.1 hypothetical protein [Hyphomonadaceae bacterium]
MRRKPVVLSLLSALALSMTLTACGARGDLKRAPPLWGDADRLETPEPESSESDEFTDEFADDLTDDFLFE